MKNLRPRQPKMEAAGDLTPPAELHEEDDLEHSPKSRSKSKSKASAKRKAKVAEEKAQSTPKKTRRTVIDPECRFVGDPIPDDEARKRWPERYEDLKSKKASSTYASSKQDDEDEEVLFAHCHYMEAEIEGCTYCLNDDVYVKGVEGEPNYIGKIVELFETNDNRLFFQAQWFYRAKDTVIQDHANLIDKKRVFLSDVKNNNPLDCIVSKLNIIQIDPNANEAKIPPCDFYFNMTYSEAYSEFANILTESARLGCDTNSTISTDAGSESGDSNPKVARRSMSLLDLYSGCGAMSTGLCLGASTADLNLVTRWAVDLNEFACESLKCNHPETEVRNESADDFLILLKEWQKLCKKFALLGTKNSETKSSSTSMNHHEEKENESKVSSGEYEVEKLVGICYGDPKDIKKPGIYFKVRWKGYDSDEDTWEPITGLSKCLEKIQEFVTWGYKSNILPLPGDADVICGGPPCQGISGFNRFRNRVAPLDDPKNHQLVVFMDIVEYLKPKFVLMENVVDILKLAKGFLGRYAVGRLVSMNYQSRLGMMVAGCYGLPQFRMRVFLWGALPTEKLPQYPLPTHDVVVRGGFPNEFERNVVAYDEDQICQREQALLLADAISDLPPITNEEIRDEMPYNEAAQTDFQKYIRSSKDELMNNKMHAKSSSRKAVLFDHRPLQLNDDDYQRVCQIPKKKGANFRDLPGVVVRSDNKVEWDESMERVYLPSGKPLVPDYAMSFRCGTSTKPFSRLWWDEIVPTVVTRAEPHNQAILHPEQDRVLSIRENARLQGFPDYYKLVGPVKQRYTQVGNAVAIPVSRALGYALSLAAQGDCSNEPLITLPARFSSFVPTPNETDVVDCSM